MKTKFAVLTILFPTLCGGGTLSKPLDIRALIAYEATRAGLEPAVAIAIAKVESNFNPRAVGSLGEIGLFQVRPEFASVSRKELFRPRINIQEGVRMLLFARKYCPHNLDMTYVTCYNSGIHRKPKYPHKLKYYRKFREAYNVQ